MSKRFSMYSFLEAVYAVPMTICSVVAFLYHLKDTHCVALDSGIVRA